MSDDPRTALANLGHLTDIDPRDLVPTPRPRLRHPQRRMPLQLPPGITWRLVLLGSTGPAAWTITMIVIALAVRYR